MSKKPVSTIGTTLAILVLLGLGSYYAATAWLGSITHTNNARIAEANAQAELYRAQQAAAQARVAEAEKEAPLYDAAGYAIETQADLVNYYARRGDARVATVWENLLALGALCFVAWYALRTERLPACLPNETPGTLAAPRRPQPPTAE